MTGEDRAGLGDPLRSALEEIARTERLLVALDFDGTLAPEVDDPDAARALPAAHAAVERLAALPGTRVALVSGRSVDDLERVSRFGDEVLLVGSHGIELRLDDPDDVIALNDKERESMTLLEQVLEQVADSLDQVWLEPKPAGYALHTRLATSRRSRVAHLVALSEARAEVDDLKVRMGKNVIEFSVRSTTKGEAVEHLRRYTDATAVLYAGDDVTDEDAFRRLRGEVPGAVTVRVGSPDVETAAEFVVDDPAAVRGMLERLAALG